MFKKMHNIELERLKNLEKKLMITSFFTTIINVGFVAKFVLSAVLMNTNYADFILMFIYTLGISIGCGLMLITSIKKMLKEKEKFLFRLKEDMNEESIQNLINLNELLKSNEIENSLLDKFLYEKGEITIEEIERILNMKHTSFKKWNNILDKLAIKNKEEIKECKDLKLLENKDIKQKNKYLELC